MACRLIVVPPKFGSASPGWQRVCPLVRPLTEPTVSSYSAPLSEEHSQVVLAIHFVPATFSPLVNRSLQRAGWLLVLVIVLPQLSNSCQTAYRLVGIIESRPVVSSNGRKPCTNYAPHPTAVWSNCPPFTVAFTEKKITQRRKGAKSPKKKSAKSVESVVSSVNSPFTVHRSPITAH